MLIMTGLEEDKVRAKLSGSVPKAKCLQSYHAIFVPMGSNNAKSCFRRGVPKEEAEGEKLISIVADHTGMAVMVSQSEWV